jgi:hypothetical protein
MTRTHSLFAACLALILGAPLFAADDNPLAGRGGTYLRLGIGCRAEAMGNASVAMLEPTTVMAYWNPAMAVMLPVSHAATGGFRLMSLSRQQGYFSYVNRIPPRAALSLAVLYHGDRTVPIFDSDGSYVYDGGYMALTAHVGLAYKINKRLSLGLNTTVHNVSITGGEYDYDRMNVWEVGNIDLSAFYAARKYLTFGLNIKEIQSSLNWAAPTYGTDFNTTITDKLPVDVKLGTTFRRALYGRAFTAAYDLDLYLVPINDDSLSFVDRFSQGDQVPEHHLGLEYFIFPEFPVRLGVATNEGFSCGAGFYFKDGRYRNLKLDYVFSVEPNGSGVNNGVSWTCSW